MVNVIKSVKGVFDRQMDNKIRSRVPFCFMMAGFMVLVAFRNTIALDYPVIILSVYAIVMAIFCDRDEMVAFGVAALPFSPAFYYDTVLATMILIYIIKYPKALKKFKLWALIPFVLMMIWEFCHEIAYGFSGMNYFYSFMTLGFTVFVVCAVDWKMDFGFVSRVLAVSTVFCCSMTLLRMLIAKNFDAVLLFSDRWYRLGIDAKHIGESISYVLRYNPNGLGAICNLSIVGLLLRMKKCGFNIIDSLLCISLVLFGALTQSRMFLLTFALAVFLYALTVQSGAFKRLRNVGILMCIGVIGIGIVWMVSPFVIEHIIARLETVDLSNGRNDLFAWYNDYLISDPEHLWFGTGVWDVLTKVNVGASVTVDNASHNGIQELVIVWGIPGVLIFGGLMLCMILAAKKSCKKLCFIGFIPLIMLFVDGLFGQIITSGATKISMCFVFVAIATDFSTGAQIKEKNEKVRLRHAKLMEK